MQADHAVSDVPISTLEIQRFGHHPNAFGALRLLFASLVIVAHVPELIYGDRHQEILTQIFGTISFGDLAVDGFFIISGYLITGSFLKSTPCSYLIRRAARIWPGFIAAFWICVLVVAPLGGATLNLERLLRTIPYCLALVNPLLPGVFVGTHSRALDASMWTISYEFRCYLILMAIGLAGLLRQRRIVLGVTIAAVSLSVIFPWTAVMTGQLSLTGKLMFYGLGSLRGNLRLVSTFLVGTCFYLYRDRVRVTPTGLLVATTGVLAGMFSVQFVTAAVATFGGYLILAAAKSQSWVNRINNENDISYGVYLYAWPI